MSDINDHLPDIRYAPTDGLTSNPNDPKYWEQPALNKEIVRTFELCHGCRLCFRYCQSFPTLFEAVDTYGDVRQIPDTKKRQVIDECFQCKLCYVNCPYTEAEGHAFKIDFPQLMLRANAQRRRQEGIPLRERLLGNPDWLGKIGTLAPALTNWANTLRLHRRLLEKVVGVHRDKLLPRFTRPTFNAWFRRQTGGAEETATGTHPVVLFVTCFGNYNKPNLGKAAYTVLTHNDCRVACPAVNCCGMPALDGGDVAFARKQARQNVERLLPYVEQGYQIAVVNPTCSLMLKQEYPELLHLPEEPHFTEAAGQVAAATRDLSEYLFGLGREGHFREDFQSTPGGPVAYHAPCHLRRQNIGFRGRDLLRRIPGAQPKLVTECCGHDGTWAMKQEYFPLALQNGQKAFDGMRNVDAELWVTDCPLAAVQFEQACGRQVLHPIEVLARAYRADGFPQTVPSSHEKREQSAP